MGSCCLGIFINQDKLEEIGFRDYARRSFQTADKGNHQEHILLSQRLAGEELRKIKTDNKNNNNSKGNLEVNYVNKNDSMNSNSSQLLPTTNERVKEVEGRLQAFERIPGMDDSKRREWRPVMCLDNGAAYEGEWDVIANKRDGYGIQITPDGAKYEGYWKEDKTNGKGRMIFFDGNVYEGDWANGKANGDGIFLHYDGSKYEGNWVNDKRDGIGIETWNDGTRYEGNYLEGKKQGKGKFSWADGSNYEGEFLNNNINGKGVYFWSDGRKYDGDWHPNCVEVEWNEAAFL